MSNPGLTNGTPITVNQKVLIPQIDGEWWEIAGNPDLGEYNSEKQEPTAFGIWKSADGRWQLFSCIRNTNCGGNTRLFHRWESENISDRNWTPIGISMEADAGYGETPGGLQTPHATKINGEYIMVFGDWENICLARSGDGKAFERQLNRAGKSALFTEGPGCGTRDPMITLIDDTYYLYYTSSPGNRGAIYCRTSKDLVNWSKSRIVSTGGSAGSGHPDAEVPVVIFLEEEQAYYLFRTHSSPDSEQFMTTVYRSPDPMDFGVNDDRYKVCTLPTEATWIINDNGEYYIASLLPGHQGTRVARLKWVYK